jgi:hypothetical protein
MPVPVIELQRRLTLVGAIRAGGEKPARGVGKKLEHWRITSPRKQLVEQAAALYGGEVSRWQSPVGEEWQVYTAVEEIPALVMPSYSLRQSYELWEGATKRTRLCDGIEEEVSGGPCLCNLEGNDQCDLYSRLVVALPELDTVLGWRVITRGASAGHELPTMMALIESRAQGQTFVPARLRLDQRRGVKDGQVVRFVVPTIDLGVGYLALATTQANGQPPSGPVRELPTVEGHTPAPNRDPTLRQALEAAEQAPAARSRRGPSAAFPPAPPETPPPPRPSADTSEAEQRGLPTPPPTPPPPPPAPPPTLPPSEQIPVGTEHAGYAEERQTKTRTEPQASKLNVLVGKLRDGGHITTEQLYASIAKLRNIHPTTMAEVIGGHDADGVLHWAPLR